MNEVLSSSGLRFKINHAWTHIVWFDFEFKMEFIFDLIEKLVKRDCN